MSIPGTPKENLFIHPGAAELGAQSAHPKFDDFLKLSGEKKILKIG